MPRSWYFSHEFLLRIRFFLDFLPTSFFSLNPCQQDYFSSDYSLGSWFQSDILSSFDFSRFFSQDLDLFVEFLPRFWFFPWNSYTILIFLRFIANIRIPFGFLAGFWLFNKFVPKSWFFSKELGCPWFTAISLIFPGLLAKILILMRLFVKFWYLKGFFPGICFFLDFLPRIWLFSFELLPSAGLHQNFLTDFWVLIDFVPKSYLSGDFSLKIRVFFDLLTTTWFLWEQLPRYCFCSDSCQGLLSQGFLRKNLFFLEFLPRSGFHLNFLSGSHFLKYFVPKSHLFEVFLLWTWVFPDVLSTIWIL